MPGHRRAVEVQPLRMCLHLVVKFETASCCAEGERMTSVRRIFRALRTQLNSSPPACARGQRHTYASPAILGAMTTAGSSPGTETGMSSSVLFATRSARMVTSVEPSLRPRVLPACTTRARCSPTTTTMINRFSKMLGRCGERLRGNWVNRGAATQTGGWGLIRTSPASWNREGPPPVDKVVTKLTSNARTPARALRGVACLVVVLH